MLIFILMVAAYFDIKEHRIPNWCILSGLAAGIWFRGIAFFVPALLVILLSFFLFYFRMLGAGDIKLMSLICGFLGVRFGIFAIGSSFVLGAGFSLVKMAVQGSMLKRYSYFLAWLRRGVLKKEFEPYYVPSRDGSAPVIPLGACFLLGTLAVFLYVGF